MSLLSRKNIQYLIFSSKEWDMRMELLEVLYPFFMTTNVASRIKSFFSHRGPWQLVNCEDASHINEANVHFIKFFI